MRRAVLVAMSGAVLSGALLVTGCDADDGPAPFATSAETAPAVTLPRTGPVTAAQVGAALRGAIGDVTDVRTITYANDPNKLLGTKGGYAQAVAVYDDRATCDTQLEVGCGARVEQWPTPFLARARRDRIAALMEELSQFAEHDYLRGDVLLRVSNALSLTEAAAYARILRGG